MLLFLVSVIVIYISEKKKTEFLLAVLLFIAAAVLFKTELFVELGFGLLFLKGKRRSKQD